MKLVVIPGWFQVSTVNLIDGWSGCFHPLSSDVSFGITNRIFLYSLKKPDPLSQLIDLVSNNHFLFSKFPSDVVEVRWTPLWCDVGSFNERLKDYFSWFIFEDLEDFHSSLRFRSLFNQDLLTSPYGFHVQRWIDWGWDQLSFRVCIHSRRSIECWCFPWLVQDRLLPNQRCPQINRMWCLWTVDGSMWVRIDPEWSRSKSGVHLDWNNSLAPPRSNEVRWGSIGIRKWTTGWFFLLKSLKYSASVRNLLKVTVICLIIIFYFF